MLVGAIQKLFSMLGVDWFEQVDCDYWNDPSRSLHPNHPTSARDIPFADRNSPVPSKQDDLANVRPEHGNILTRLVSEIRRRDYSIRTEQAYESWVLRFIAFSGDRSPVELGAEDVFSFLESLAVGRNVSGSTQSQALNALVFLFEQVVKKPLGELGDYARPERPRRLPVLLTKDKVSGLLGRLDGTHYLIAALIHGTGMRLMFHRGGQGVISPLDVFSVGKSRHQAFSIASLPTN